MTKQDKISDTEGYSLTIAPVRASVTVTRHGRVLAKTDRAKVMYETRLPQVIYIPREDVQIDLGEQTALQTFCPFKGTAWYYDLDLGGETLPNAVWSYVHPLPESVGIADHVAFASGEGIEFDISGEAPSHRNWGDVSGPMVNWLLREAVFIDTPDKLTAAFAHKLIENGIAVSRISVMIWSLHPMIAGRNFVWNKSDDTVSTYAPSYEIHDHPAFINSPVRHVSNGLGGVRQRLGDDYDDNSFPIIEDLRAKGATDYVAMPLPFSDGQINVLALTCDHPDGFTTANLGLIFECSAVMSRYYEVFNQRENAQSLLETYLGPRTGARVLGGDIRRGDGDEIDAAILFCDLRGSTRLEEEMERDAYISLLNHFFETTSNIVHDHGGEVLKFIGDAVLAVFPAGDDPGAACAQALAASRDIVSALEADAVTHDCACSIGIAFGRVTYGNVGSQGRLDFTVIGHAANVAARLCDHAKTVGYTILASEDVAAADDNTTFIGQTPLHNVAKPVQCVGVHPHGTDTK